MLRHLGVVARFLLLLVRCCSLRERKRQYRPLARTAREAHLIAVIPSPLRVSPLPLTPKHRRINAQPPSELPTIRRNDLIPPLRRPEVRRICRVADKVDRLGRGEDLRVDGDATVRGCGVGGGSHACGEEGEEGFGVVGHADGVEGTASEMGSVS